MKFKADCNMFILHPFSVYGMTLCKDRHNFIGCKIFWHLGTHECCLCWCPFLLLVVHFEAFASLEVRGDLGSLWEPFRCFENLWDKAHRGRENWQSATGEMVPNVSLSNKKESNRHNSYHFEEEDVYGYQGNSGMSWSCLTYFPRVRKLMPLQQCVTVA